jgi:hypothetical protein
MDSQQIIDSAEVLNQLSKDGVTIASTADTLPALSLAAQ